MDKRIYVTESDSHVFMTDDDTLTVTYSADEAYAAARAYKANRTTVLPTIVCSYIIFDLDEDDTRDARTLYFNTFMTNPSFLMIPDTYEEI